MRSEEDIKAGLAEVERFINEKIERIQLFVKIKDWENAYQANQDLTVSFIAIMSVTDACFGE